MIVIRFLGAAAFTKIQSYRSMCLHFIVHCIIDIAQHSAASIATMAKKAYRRLSWFPLMLEESACCPSHSDITPHVPEIDIIILLGVL